METKTIDGKEYTKVGITGLSINGEDKENSFSFNDLDNQGQIFFDIKIDSGAYANGNSFTSSSLDMKNLKSNNIIISDKPLAKSSIDTSNTIQSSNRNVNNSNDNKSHKTYNKINYWYYAIFATALTGLLYFIFIK